MSLCCGWATDPVSVTQLRIAYHVASPLGIAWEDAVLDGLDMLEPDVVCVREDAVRAAPPVDVVIVLFDPSDAAGVGRCIAAAARLDASSEAARVLVLACGPSGHVDLATLQTDMNVLGLPETGRTEVAVELEDVREWTSRIVSVTARVRASNGRVSVQQDAANPDSLQGSGRWQWSELFL